MDLMFMQMNTVLLSFKIEREGEKQKRENESGGDVSDALLQSLLLYYELM